MPPFPLVTSAGENMERGADFLIDVEAGEDEKEGKNGEDEKEESMEVEGEIS